ncbi:DUF2914 domain-containing protein [Methylophilus aquaticus]|uniref:DUF2914 domain-containing protein n=1 Tax=Methylophilus aquaticus TaxID=1971610 RepID=A0ABT9JUA0_9PROT|nr:DUF2914 domain-containing protein [Methylophilus aquaticus]MDP8568158.1 DUF2914 domain-containing protein [Methylophilus aquaticus]
MTDELQFSVFTGVQAFLKWLVKRAKLSLPILFFIGGFVWDAITIGHQVNMSDIAIFAVYVTVAGWIMHQLATPAEWCLRCRLALGRWRWLDQKMAGWPIHDWPYWILQFLFGSLLSALFILYFKSSSDGMAWLITLVLGIMLIANEFLESEYRRLTLCWSMFGLCSILFFNFAFPYLLGSVHAVWFYLSTTVGVLASYALYRHAPRHSGSIWPVWLIGALLMLAYRFDMIPPVPLVKQAVVVAYAVEKTPQGYWLTLEKSPWWRFWRIDSDQLVLVPGERLVCFSAVFAPKGLHTRLLHNWEKFEGKHWVSYGAPGFQLAGGRDGGYRGYTYKSNLSSGKWRVRIQNETGQTIAINQFTVTINPQPAATDRQVRVRY